MKIKENKTMYLTIKIIIALIIGGGLGFGWYKLVGCSSGTCPITANPWTSTFYGAGLALLFVLSQGR